MKADAGRIAANPDVAMGPLALALFEVPDELRLRSSDGSGLMLAASTATVGWLRQSIQVDHAGRNFAMRTPRIKSLLGKLVSAAGADEPNIEIVLHDPDHWLISCSDHDLELGDNLAMLGSEAIQFGEAISLGGGSFRLTNLLRGRAGTEGACHSSGERFVLIDRAALEPVSLPRLVPGEPVGASALDGSAQCSLTLKD
jgi:hypothetical protein